MSASGTVTEADRSEATSDTTELTSGSSGQEVVVAQGDQPVARLVPIEEQQDRVLGFVPYAIPDAFFEPLPDDELAT